MFAPFFARASRKTAEFYYIIPFPICQEENCQKNKKTFFPKTLDKGADL